MSGTVSVPASVVTAISAPICVAFESLFRLDLLPCFSSFKFLSLQAQVFLACTAAETRLSLLPFHATSPPFSSSGRLQPQDSHRPSGSSRVASLQQGTQSQVLAA